MIFSNRVIIDELIITSAKTVIGYSVFFVFLFTVPIYQEFKDNSFIYDYIEQKTAVFGQSVIKIHIADTNEERIQGLSGKNSLEKNRGLFFVFEKEDYHGIWMKNMNFPIDIIWFNQQYQVVHIEKNIKPETYPNVFKPKHESLYVLEMPAGFADENAIKKGDEINIL